MRLEKVVIYKHEEKNQGFHTVPVDKEVGFLKKHMILQTKPQL